MKLTVLGSGPSCPNPGGACSGFLLQQDDTLVLLDCGSGVVSNLQAHTKNLQLAAIIISHMHADHFLDIIPFRYGLKYGPLRDNRQGPALYLPPGGKAQLRSLVATISEDADFFRGAFEVQEYSPEETLRLGVLEASFRLVEHPIPTYAVAISAGERRVVYSSDTGYSPSLARFAREADLLICEASAQESDLEAIRSVHLTASEAGRLAHEARVRSLLLTHLWQPFYVPTIVAAAARYFDGPVRVAIEHASYEV